MDLLVYDAVCRAELNNDYTVLAELVRSGSTTVLQDANARNLIADVLVGKVKKKMGRPKYNFYHSSHETYTEICIWFGYFRALGYSRWESTGKNKTALSLTAEKTHVSSGANKKDPVRHALKVTYCGEGKLRNGVRQGLMAKYYIDQGVLKEEDALESYYSAYLVQSEGYPDYFRSSDFYNELERVFTELINGKAKR